MQVYGNFITLGRAGQDIEKPQALLEDFTGAKYLI